MFIADIAARAGAARAGKRGGAVGRGGGDSTADEGKCIIYLIFPHHGLLNHPAPPPHRFYLHGPLLCSWTSVAVVLGTIASK